MTHWILERAWVETCKQVIDEVVKLESFMTEVINFGLDQVRRTEHDVV